MRAQAENLFQVLLTVHIVIDALRDDRTYVGNLQQLLHARRLNGVYVAEMTGYLTRGGLPDISYPEGEQHALERHGKGIPETVQELLRGLVLPALKRYYLVLAEVVQVRRRAHEPGVEELLHGGLPGKDVHGLAGDEMLYSALDLGGAAVLVRAEPLRLGLAPDQRRTAVGAGFREHRGNACGRAQGLLHGGDLRDDLAALLHIDPVPDAHVELGHPLVVVESGPLHHRAAELDGGEVGHGGHRAGPSHLIVDAQDLGAGLLGLEFIRDRPSRGLGGVSEAPLGGKLVDLDHYAVGGERQELALRVPIVDVVLDLADVAANLALVADGKAP